MKNRSWMLAVCFALSVTSIVLLHKISDYLNHRPNGFVRLFPSHRVIPVKSINIRFNSYYISGATESNIFLANYTAPGRLIITDYFLSDTQQVSLKSFREAIHFTGNTSIEIDSPHIYLKQEKIPAIFHGLFSDSSFKEKFNLDSIYFSSCIALSPSSFVVRTYNNMLKQNILTKISIVSGKMISKNYLLEKQEEGYFSTDGTLQYETSIGALIYVYHYYNRFVRLDTNLNVVYKGQTIDTISKTNLNVVKIKSENFTTLSTPPLMVNKRSAVDSGYIFINSVLKANNEPRDIFDKYSVIDVYRIDKGKYLFSFYIGSLMGKKISSFRVFNKTLVMLNDNFLVLYRLNF